MIEMMSLPNMEELFKGRHFDREIIVLCVRWYLRYKLSFRDLVEMMGERGLSLAHTTIMRRIQCYVPEFEKRWNRPWRWSARRKNALAAATSRLARSRKIGRASCRERVCAIV